MSIRTLVEPVEHTETLSVPARMRTIPRVLSIAGTDPTGGAGIQADLKSIGALGGYGMAVVTSLVAQNTCGVRSVHTPPSAFLVEQLRAVSDDVAIDAVKIGMLGDAETIRCVREWLPRASGAVVVLDPVMVATSGDRLLAAEAEDELRELVPLADLVTPNLPELAVLLREPVAQSWEEALNQGKRLAGSTGTSVLVKGGHLDALAGGGNGSSCPDALVDASDGTVTVETGARINTRNTHGTGCSLSAALATVQARTGDWNGSLQVVKKWLRGALERAGELNVGEGNGPIHHFHEFLPGAAGGATREKGPFSEQVWELTAHQRASIDSLDFVRALGDGSLPAEQFAYYLAQDALYLRGYSRVLSRASSLAPTEAEQLFWAQAALNCLEVESELHRTWLSKGVEPVGPGPVTKAYVDHLLAASAHAGYAVLVAAVLPCFWLYAHVGNALHTQWTGSGADRDHPYADWIQTYADPAFAEATARAVAYADAAFAGASATDRTAMIEAFEASAWYEHEFFDAPMRLDLRESAELP
ncbi:bifunctional hydroxymethylpyrimidine kinase/phosphomethylpyrimidine kinase [uncultured Arthrobacter sp.]|uniref:bifunctional hydroxymethylpyrimidine kinase/phosphomethylpyrimidine kinase n=1 Tax=uncultured Arthrobacter sp. TaxID=114050 RepID=UPI0026226C5A|nr:bifunctional hydroxymethylpyrimidine kinase/phosphomethylpyrimidine kinase [uncultured Arthrobacter sp.]